MAESTQDRLTDALEGATREITRLRRAVRARTQALLMLLAAVAVVGIGGAWWSLTESDRLHDLVDQDCAAFQAIGTIPLPASAAPIAHQIIDGARTAYDGRCIEVGGPLPPVPTITGTT